MKKCCWGLALVALLATLPAVAQETPEAGIQAGGVAKVLYSFGFKDEETRFDGREDFAMSLVELRLSGNLGEHIDWNVEVAASWFADDQMGNLGSMANQDETGGAGIRQASFRISGIVPYTTFELGTFIPHLSNYMSRRVENLDLIQYPLMNNAVYMDTGWLRSGVDMSPWQQTGFNAEIRLPYMIELDVGVWNGMMPDRTAQPDPNPSKATSIVLSYRPVEHLTLSFGHWGEDFQNEGAPGTFMGHGRRQLNIWYGWASYLTDTINITADFAQASVPSDYILSDGSRADWRWEGAQVTVGYWFRPNFEALVRYEYFDPNTLDTVKIPSSRYDRSQWYTMGINYRLNDNAEVSVNYVIKQEQGEFIEKGEGGRRVGGKLLESGRDPLKSDWDPKYSSQHNNLFLVQFQLWQ